MVFVGFNMIECIMFKMRSNLITKAFDFKDLRHKKILRW